MPLVWLWPAAPVDARLWHAREMGLGVAQAALAGYLLTALPHWGGGQMSRRGVWALAALWVAGRLGGEILPLVFPAALSLCLARRVLLAGLWARLPLTLAPAAVATGFQAMQTSGEGGTPILMLTILLAGVGGRIIPAFLRARRTAPPMRGGPGRWADLPLWAALALHLLSAPVRATGAMLILAGLAQALRAAFWPLRGLPRGGRADLVLLLIGWLWLPVGLVLGGLAQGFALGLPEATARHALAMGAFGGLMLAVMARAVMARAPGALRPGAAVLAAFGLIQIATLLRLIGDAALPAALAAWSGGWLIAAGLFLRACRRPVPHPVLSARRGV